MTETVLEARDVWFAYDGRQVLEAVHLSVARGELIGMLGPNGSGKSTLVRLLSGLLRPDRGVVRLEGTDLARIPRRDVARRIAVVPQEIVHPFGLTTREMVLLGRTPHVRPFLGPGAADRRVAEDKMALTDTLALADRPFNELSGGEQQRVTVAMALAQEAPILLLDEPTVHLDINHQVEILDLIRRLNREQGLTVLVILHDLNLAALYFDRLLLLHERRILCDGAPREVLEEGRVRAVFGERVLVRPHPASGAPQVVVVPPEDGARGVPFACAEPAPRVEPAGAPR